MKEREKQRITANLPKSLLQEAVRTTNKGITETLILGLQMVKRSKASQIAEELKGKLDIDLDLDLSRERTRR